MFTLHVQSLAGWCILCIFLLCADESVQSKTSDSPAAGPGQPCTAGAQPAQAARLDWADTDCAGQSVATLYLELGQ